MHGFIRARRVKMRYFFTLLQNECLTSLILVAHSLCCTESLIEFKQNHAKNPAHSLVDPPTLTVPLKRGGNDWSLAFYPDREKE